MAIPLAEYFVPMPAARGYGRPFQLRANQALGELNPCDLFFRNDLNTPELNRLLRSDDECSEKPNAAEIHTRVRINRKSRRKPEPVTSANTGLRLELGHVPFETGKTGHYTLQFEQAFRHFGRKGVKNKCR
ncbi:protein of unknown function [Methylocaldum szegediense]|uniref:Transposase n=1 Tax=Methylocaldum szegediense TaxID=73780 RepID=A0ABM9I5Y7_9GAMM|nr:protein of unknown function [Methylocaldum szegediense]